MRRRCRPKPLLPAVLLLAACASTPPVDPDPERLLGTAEALVTARDYDQALAQLDLLSDTICPKRLRDRRDLARAGAHLGLGQYWDAFLALEQFSDLYPHSELRPAVVEMLWDIGRTLATSDRGFWIFWSDRRGGRTVLEHLITRHPDTQRLADALRLLGDMAYEDGNYELAQERFRDLMRRRPESEWVKYAGFRFAMSIVDSLQGPDYDLDKMNLAVRELSDFLATAPENPELVTKAGAALEKLREWRAERHLSIAGFYRRVGNVAGQRYHLDIASRSEFEGTAAHAAAVEQRAELDRATAPGATP
ncbi:MAG: outer membrane protein assembly factor BamD [Planctomycetes bacterium]|nr:outer membrane protein assembly factor BamD [Planctomycetota bacterium]